ncbi:tetratricopeptide repeat-containing sensor histidine kinase [Flavobacterium sp. LB2R40]|uniref:tetratricopeptide repeat-containing sensor histidine kinase n=1 Tax=Flavobacterium sp. LB2R40 TaxID=3401722 RepID=UPI003AB0D94B
MASKKTHLIFWFLLSTTFLLLQSCKKREENTIIKKHSTVEIDRLIELGHLQYENGKFDSSYYYFNRAKFNSDLKKDTSRIIHSLAWLAQIERVLGDYSSSEATAVEALPFLENTKNFPNGRWNIYNALGNNYLYTSDFTNALYYFNKALNLKTDQIDKASITNNIALIHIEKGDYQQALKILLPLIKKKEVINHSQTFANIIDNIGEAYDKSENALGLYYFNKGLKIKTQIKDHFGMISSYYHLSNFYKEKNPALSDTYAHLAYEKATTLNSVDDRLQCLELLIKNTPVNQSKKFSLLYLQINDSINKIRQKAKNQFAKIRYDSTKEKEENLKLKAQKILQEEKEQNRNLLFYGVVGTIILISLFISNLLVAKNNKEKTKATYNTEIRIAKRLHDELANDIYQSIAFAETKDLSESQNKEILLTNLDGIYSRTRNISRENNTIETGSLFLSHLKEMMSGFNTDMVNVLTIGIDTITWSTLENHKKIIVYRVLQELLVNMKKHSKCSLVVLTFKENKNKLQIDYTDNGIGIGNNELNSKNGLLNVENRIRAIKGTITFDTKSNTGFKIQFIFPI